MTPTTPSIGFRIPAETLEKLDRYAAQATKESGFEVNRTMALLKVLKIGFEQIEARPAKKR
jgi:hypothetical protein